VLAAIGVVSPRRKIITFGLANATFVVIETIWCPNKRSWGGDNMLYIVLAALRVTHWRSNARRIARGLLEFIPRQYKKLVYIKR
jgi:hypothetical protein